MTYSIALSFYHYNPECAFRFNSIEFDITAARLDFYSERETPLANNGSTEYAIFTGSAQSFVSGQTVRAFDLAACCQTNTRYELTAADK